MRLSVTLGSTRERDTVVIGEPTCNGELTHVDLEIAGTVRRIAVTREAIELEVAPTDGLSPDEMCEFVRNNLPRVEAAVRRQLGESSEPVDVVMIRAGEL